MRQIITFLIIVYSTVFATGCVKEVIKYQTIPVHVPLPPDLPKLTNSQEEFLRLKHPNLYRVLVTRDEIQKQHIILINEIIDAHNNEIN